MTAYRLKLLLVIPLAQPDRSDGLWILGRVETIKVVELIVEMRASRVKPGHEGHCFENGTWHGTGISRAFKQRLLMIGFELVKVNQIASEIAFAIGVVSIIT